MEKSGVPVGLLSKVFDKVLIGTAYISAVLIVVMMLFISYDVVLRYFFKSPTNWVGDFSGYMQYAAVLLGAAWVLKIRGHTKIDILVQHLRSRTQQILHFITTLIALIACALFLWMGITATLDAIQSGEFLYRGVEVPIAPLYAFIPFSFLLLCIQFGRDLYNNWQLIRTGSGQDKPS
jgi:C4-dicarboxylate transporter DctQ subunit